MRRTNPSKGQQARKEKRALLAKAQSIPDWVLAEGEAGAKILVNVKTGQLVPLPETNDQN